MQIFLKPPHGSLKVLNVRPSDTVGSVKQKAAEKEGIPPDMTYLRKGSLALKDSRMLSDYNIQREATLELMISSRAANTAAAQLQESKAGAEAAKSIAVTAATGAVEAAQFYAFQAQVHVQQLLSRQAALVAANASDSANSAQKHAAHAAGEAAAVAAAKTALSASASANLAQEEAAQAVRAAQARMASTIAAEAATKATTALLPGLIAMENCLQRWEGLEKLLASGGKANAKTIQSVYTWEAMLVEDRRFQEDSEMDEAMRRVVMQDDDHENKEGSEEEGGSEEKGGSEEVGEERDEEGGGEVKAEEGEKEGEQGKGDDNWELRAFNFSGGATHFYFSSDVRKWFRTSDGRYQGMFENRLHSLKDGIPVKSRVHKPLQHTISKNIWETKLDRGQRILWQIEEDGVIFVAFVSKHDDVKRKVKLMEDAPLRLSHHEKQERGEGLAVGGALLNPQGNRAWKIYSISYDDLPRLRDSHWEPPLRMSPEEQIIVDDENGVLLIGRSGTGKTICIMNRMDRDRQRTPDQQNFGQLFVARSRRLCSLVRRYHQKRPNAPTHTAQFETYARVMEILEEKMQLTRRWVRSRKVNFSTFRSAIWPKLAPLCNNADRASKVNSASSVSSPARDPSVVWMQIRSFIKGGARAAAEGRPLTKAEYLDMSHTQVRHGIEERPLLYAMYESYQSILEKQTLWDETDRIRAIVIAQQNHHGEQMFDRIYADEVQDSTMSEMVMLLHAVGGDPTRLFLAGDTAQAITHGVSFRFEDVRSVVHLITRNGKIGRPHKLTTNFRSHARIIQLGNAVLELLLDEIAFPTPAFDKLRRDVGLSNGPYPVLVERAGDLQQFLRHHHKAVIL
jgi:hypothetical protein